MKKDGFSPLHEQEDFFLFPKHQEMLGNEAQECGISLVLEWTGMEAESRGDMSVVYILFRYNEELEKISCFLNVVCLFVNFHLSSLPCLGGLHLISSKIAVLRRHTCIPYSSTPCLLVSERYVCYIHSHTPLSIGLNGFLLLSEQINRKKPLPPKLGNLHVCLFSSPCRTLVTCTP